MLQKLKFRVVHVTSQDEKFPATELNHIRPNARGWRSEKNCPYPQQIVVELENSSRIRKIQILSHQFLIASKVEFFVGDSCGEDTINMNTSRFHRLGHIELSNNEVSNFKARELKSVHIDAHGSCFQIFLYKNYVNILNPFNQISIIALNFIGYTIESNGIDDIPHGEGPVNFPNVSPLDDLAFDVYQDPRLTDIIRRLQCQKLEYARQENFDMAKKAKDAIQYLQEIGEQLFRLELEKREAVKLENYDEAKEKKNRILKLRDDMVRHVDLDSLLCTAPRPQQYLRPVASSVDPPTPLWHQHQHSTGGQTAESEVDLEQYAANSTASSEDADPVSHWHNAADERPLPALLNKEAKNTQVQDERNYEEGDTSPFISSSNKPDQEQVLPEAITRQASIAIDVVGLPLVTLFYSRSWNQREDALTMLKERVSREPLPPPVAIEAVSAEPDPVGELRSTTFLLKKALGDQVLTVYRKALELIYPLVVEFGERHQVAKPEISASVDKLIRLLVQRTGDSSTRIRDITKIHLIEMAGWPAFRHSGGFWREVLRPFQPTTLERLALSQMEIVSDIYGNMGASEENNPRRGTTSGFVVDDLITFAVQALEHRSNEVRELAEALVLALYRAEDRRSVRQMMPPNDVETQRQPLYRRIFAKFDKLDGSEHSSIAPSLPENGSQLQPEAPCKSRKRTQLSSSPPRRTPVTPKSPLPPKQHSPAQSVSPNATITNELDLLLSLDKTCIFCGERNDSFTEEVLDMHYWKVCPMLRRCPNCKQVVEISGLTEHLLDECPESSRVGGYRRCDRCSEAVPNALFASHKSCKATSSGGALRCPLCHVDLRVEGGRQPFSPEDAWKAHLIGECTQNSRISRPSTTDAGSRAGSSVQGNAKNPIEVFPGKRAVVKRTNVR